MFYDIFAQLCYDNMTTPNAVCLDLGLSNSTATYWKKSGKNPKRETLEKIAERFGVSVDYLIGRETKNAPAGSGESAEAILSESKTLSEWETIMHGLSRENKIKLFEYAQLLLLSQVQDEKEC